jgi:hypothetical protein
MLRDNDSTMVWLALKVMGEQWNSMRMAFERDVIFMDLAMASATSRIGIL